MPLIYSIEKLIALNEFLKQKHLHILYKAHFLQDMKSAKTVNLENIHFISDSMIRDVGMQLYEIIGGSSALITDYSSVFYDYLLLDHPIATTIDDIESWKKGRGFSFDIEKMHDQATVRVKNLDELFAFLNDVSEGIDRKQQGRRQIRDITHTYIDGKSTDRVVDFICDYLKKHF
jgi:CDP-glycerol glycerophosphotransferase (TagB/SpsB family)